jgi:ceramide glucosyltransferase
MLSALLSLFGLSVLAVAVYWHVRLMRVLSLMPPLGPRLRCYPSVSVVRPVRGCDVGAAENFAAALETGYPGEVQTIFVFDDEADPALPVAREVVLRHRRSGGAGTAEVLVAGPPPAGFTGKQHAMMVGMRRASGELIGFGDSDTRPDRRVLKSVVDSLLDTPGAGAAFAPVVVYRPPRALGDAFYALMQNALYSPWAALAAGPHRDLPFIMGQLMVLRRETLRAIGGIACTRGQLVDDMHMGRCVAAAGFRNVLAYHPLHIETGRMTLRDFLPYCRRWLLFSKNGLPNAFTWRQCFLGAGFNLCAIATVFAFLLGYPEAALSNLLSVLIIGASLARVNRQHGGGALPLRLKVASWMIVPILTGVYFVNLMSHEVTWRGRPYQLTNKAELEFHDSSLRSV